MTSLETSDTSLPSSSENTMSSSTTTTTKVDAENSAQDPLPKPHHRRSSSTNSHFATRVPTRISSTKRNYHPSDAVSWRAPAGGSPSFQQQQRFSPHGQRLGIPMPYTRAVSDSVTSRTRAQRYISEPVSNSMVISESARFVGVVHSLKHSYGFVRCELTGDRVFFHFSELDQNSIAALPSDAAGKEQPPVRVGDRVEFSRAHDVSTGREKATAVTVLQRSPFGYANPIPTHIAVIPYQAQLGSTPNQVDTRLNVPVPYSSGTQHRNPSPEAPSFTPHQNHHQQQQHPSVHQYLPHNQQQQLQQSFDPHQNVYYQQPIRQFHPDQSQQSFYLPQPQPPQHQDPQVQHQEPGQLQEYEQNPEQISQLQKQSDDSRGVHDVQAMRETGVVVSAKHNYGFIKCAQREHKQVFFHFSEVISPTSLIAPGTEIEFTISPNMNGKVVATHITILPQGSVQFATVDSDIITGVVVAGVRNANSTSQKTRRKARPSSMDIGSLVVSALELRRNGVEVSKNEPECTLSFSGADVRFPSITLMEGDEVQFRLKTDRRTNTRTATEVMLVRPARLGRERGIVTIWKELYGFLKCDGRKEHLFFHLNEFINKSHQPQVGDELEFNVALDNRGQDNAVRVSVLDKGSVKLNEDRIFGVILSRPALFNAPVSRRETSNLSVTSSGQTASYGIIRLFPIQDSLGNPVELSEEQIAQLKPLPAEHSLASLTLSSSATPFKSNLTMPESTSQTAPVSPISEETPKCDDSADDDSKVSNKNAPPRAVLETSFSTSSYTTETSPLDSVRFTLADRASDATPIRVGDIVSLAVAPAPKFMRASNICLVPKIGVVCEVGSSHASLTVSETGFASSEDFMLRLHDLPSDFGAINVGDHVEIVKIENGSCPRAPRSAKNVRRVDEDEDIRQCVISKLKILVPELNESFSGVQQYLPNFSPNSKLSNSVGGSDSVTSYSPVHDKLELSMSPKSQGRWDSRLEPRNWS